MSTPAPSPSPSGDDPSQVWGITPQRLADLGHALVPYAVAVGVLLMAWIVVGVVLNRRAPLAYWYLYGFWFLLIRMRHTWVRLALNANLTAADKPSTSQLGSLAVRGRAIRPAMPVLFKIRPQHYGATASIGMYPGQVPQRFIDASEAMAHAWAVHAVRVVPGKRGRLELTILREDPLKDHTALAAAEVRTGPPRAAVPADLQATVGVREDDQPWVIDLTKTPHVMVTGATQSGKSTMINAAFAQWAHRPIALVGIDCKGGMELGPNAPRLSALARDRQEAAEVLAQLVTEAKERMALCVRYDARSIWELPDDDQPVPVVVIVDELAELFLVAGKDEKEAAQRATTNLIRLAQLGATLGIHVLVAAQRLGSELGVGVTTLRAQLAGRICHQVHDKETAEMVFGDLFKDAVEAAQLISEDEKGVAITRVSGGWIRARSIKVPDAELSAVVRDTAHLTPRLNGLTPPALSLPTQP
jgi:DNA segregation ATPase FtsK/SpoIIIE, S-DNA-T family